jgi:glycerol uptake operon antiterminator
MRQDLIQTICPGPVVPAARNYEDFQWALAHSPAPGVIILFGDINSLPGLLAEAGRHGKRLLVHFDLLEGIGRDKAGVKCLARMGVTALITTKSQLVKAARDEGLIVVQRLFLVDSEALNNAVRLIKRLSPDAVEVLPASVPEWVFARLAQETGLPIMAGGLVNAAVDVDNALANGAYAVSASCRELW